MSRPPFYPGMNNRCPTCGLILEPGFLVTRGAGTFLQSVWLPRDSTAEALDDPERASPLVVIAYRCERCGRLEFFAHPA